MCTQREQIKKILTRCNLANFIKTFSVEFHKLLSSIVERYRDAFSPEDLLIFRYKLEHDVAGCFQVFSDWFVNDSPLPVEQIVSMLNSMNVSAGQYRHIPNILVRISEE
jgi:hypothetical protein